MTTADDIEKFIKKTGLETKTEMNEVVRNRIFQAFEKSKQTKSTLTKPNIWRIIMRSPITKLAAAAVIIGGVILGLNITGGPDIASVTWADVLKEISGFRPYTCTVTVQYKGIPSLSKSVMIFSLTQRREVYPNGTIIVFDLAVPKTLTLVPEKKYAIERMSDSSPGKDFDLLELVNSMYNKPADEIGVQKIEGRAAKGFRSLSKVNDITVWADVQTKLPVRVEIIHVGKDRKIIYTEFKFDVEFDESLFSTTAPEGYTVEKVERGGLTELQKFVRSTTEEDLIEGLRATAVFLGGKFPPEIELSQLQNAFRQYIKQNNLSESEVEERLKPVSEKWTKAHWYTRLLRGEMEVGNFRYAGEGVKLGDVNTPVIWWQPKGSETYRVIYGDLSIRDVSPENLPK